jgi:hypothetical protein
VSVQSFRRPATHQSALELLTESVVAKAISKRRRVPDKPEFIVPPEPLPDWRDEVRGIANDVLRSALFNAKNLRAPRRYMKNEPIAVVYDTAKITYTGEELRQNDELVWLQLIHLARNRMLTGVIEFSPYSVANAIKRTKPNANAGHICRLLDSLRRLQATALCIHSKRLGRSISFSMIPKFEWQDEVTGERLSRWRVYLAPELVELFGGTHYARINWEQRLALPVGLATWMHGYLATHRVPYRLSLSELKKGSGCTTKSKARFRQLVSAALSELKRVKFLTEGELCGDFIHVVRKLDP